MTDHYVPNNPLERALQTERDYSQMLNEKLRSAYAELDALRAENTTLRNGIAENGPGSLVWSADMEELRAEVARLTAVETELRLSIENHLDTSRGLYARCKEQDEALKGASYERNRMYEEIERLRGCVVKAKGALVDANIASVNSSLPHYMEGAPADMLTGWYALWGCINRCENWLRTAVEEVAGE